MIALKLGLRNLFRNRWRSGLTLAAVAVAVGLMVWTLGFYEGWIQQMVRGATAVETTQAQIQTAGYIESPRVYRTFTMDSSRLATLRQLPGVQAVTPRVELAGLLGNEQRSQVARFKGVDPRLEAEATPVTDGIVEGRWLAESPPDYPAPREIVLGEGVAQQLRVGVGAELVVFLEAADGSLGNELLEVVGIVRTQNTEIDRLTGYMHIEDARWLWPIPWRRPWGSGAERRKKAPWSGVRSTGRTWSCGRGRRSSRPWPRWWCYSGSPTPSCTCSSTWWPPWAS